MDILTFVTDYVSDSVKDWLDNNQKRIEEIAIDILDESLDGIIEDNVRDAIESIINNELDNIDIVEMIEENI